MESVEGKAASAGVRDHDLVRLYEASGMFLTLWSPTAGAVEQAAEHQATLWRRTRSRAAEAGADEELLDDVEPFYADAYTFGDGMIVVGADDGVRLVEHLADPPPAELVRRSPLPSIVPVIKQRQAIRSHVIVLADRTGADLLSVSRSGHVETQEVEEISEHPIHKPRGQALSHRRIQQRAENSWEHNARAVADEIEAAASRIDASVVIVAGDERATSTITGELTGPVREMVRNVPGGRHPDGSADALEARVDTVIRTEVAAQTKRLLEQYDEEREKQPEVADDVDGILAALAAAQVDTLLVHDDPDDETTVWYDPGGLTVARDPNVFGGLYNEPVPARLVDAAVRSALLGGASVHVAPASKLPAGRLGAILRWT